MSWNRFKNRTIARLITEFPSLAERLARSYAPWESEDVPWTRVAKPLSECCIAVVTTAGLHHHSQKPFDMIDREGDPSYRVIDSAESQDPITITHDYYDHRDAERDLNIVFPIDRLREFSGKGIIGSVARRHYSFMGHITGRHIRALISRTAPEVARLLMKAEVDAVLLTPG